MPTKHPAFIWTIIMYQICSSLIVNSQEYFQQEVNYKIEAKLDDVEDKLRGNVSFTYINHSPDSLDKLYLHLWPNAYASNESAFSRDLLRRGNRDFFFSSEEDRGFIDSLNFRTESEQLNWEFDPQYNDIAILFLRNELLPGDSVVIKSSFRLKIPSSFSRSGRSKNVFHFTQWYPKPAVYDLDGWHPMPYLQMGEFYAEFGKFDVRLELPPDYMVAAGGEPIGEVENEENGYKSWHFAANSTHDFAWFASKEFILESDTLELASGKVIDISLYKTKDQEEIWKFAMEYTKRALLFFSEQIGEYPYQCFSVVQSIDMGSSSMEYPMITAIDDVIDSLELDHVIAHEVGHNWFQGILGFNERKMAWMDEGLTSYFDHKYIQKIYNDDHFSNYLPPFIRDHLQYPLINYAFSTQAFRYLDQAPQTELSKFSSINYALSNYGKPILFFRYLENYLGSEKLKQLFRGFYDQWKFRHPGYRDLENYFTAHANAELSWFFEDLIYTGSPMDYSIIGIEKYDGYRIRIKNEARVSAPIELVAVLNDSIVARRWIEGFKGEKEIDFFNVEADQFIIDPDGVAPEIDQSNNKIHTSGIFKKRKPLDYKLWFGFDNREKSRRFISPLLAFNHYDGFMIGLLEYSAFVPARNFQNAFTGLWGLKGKSVVGSWNLRWNHYFDNQKPDLFTINLGIRRFTFFNHNEINYKLKYFKIKPAIEYSFKSDFASNKTNYLRLKTHFVSRDQAIFNDDNGEYVGNELKTQMMYQMEYDRVNYSALYPSRFQTSLEFDSYHDFTNERHHYLRIKTEYDLSAYFQANKKIDFRFFVSYFLSNTQRNNTNTNPAISRGSIPFTYQGFSDYYFEDLFFGRSEQTGFLSKQIYLNEGGFKNALGSAFSNIGHSNDWMISFNMKTDFPVQIPGGIPLKLFCDLAAFNSKTNISEPLTTEYLYSLGLTLEFFDGSIGLYLPILNSNKIDVAYDSLEGNYFKRISFSIDLSKLNVWKQVDRIGF